MDNRLTARGMLAQAFEFKKFNFVSGDYFEFGLWRGATFRIAHQMKHRFGQTEMLLWGFDSFQGLPPSAERRDNIFHEGEFACGESELRRILRRSGFQATIRLVPDSMTDLNDAHGSRAARRYHVRGLRPVRVHGARARVSPSLLGEWIDRLFRRLLSFQSITRSGRTARPP
jgi:hypothetical protein